MYEDPAIMKTEQAAAIVVLVLASILGFALLIVHELYKRAFGAL
jgi:hypothetical protein